MDIIFNSMDFQYFNMVVYLVLVGFSLSPCRLTPPNWVGLATAENKNKYNIAT